MQLEAFKMQRVMVTNNLLRGGRTGCLYLYLYLYLYQNLYLYMYLYNSTCICICIIVPVFVPSHGYRHLLCGVTHSQNIDGAILGDWICAGKHVDQDHC